MPLKRKQSEPVKATRKSARIEQILVNAPVAQTKAKKPAAKKAAKAKKVKAPEKVNNEKDEAPQVEATEDAE